MKTLKIKLLTLGITLVLMSVVFISHARDGSNIKEINDIEYFEQYMEAEELMTDLEMPVKTETKVRIYNSDNKLVISGNKEDENIKNLLRVSDLLTEVEETEYYILSY